MSIGQGIASSHPTNLLKYCEFCVNVCRFYCSVIFDDMQKPAGLGAVESYNYN